MKRLLLIVVNARPMGGTWDLIAGRAGWCSSHGLIFVIMRLEGGFPMARGAGFFARGAFEFKAVSPFGLFAQVQALALAQWG